MAFSSEISRKIKSPGLRLLYYLILLLVPVSVMGQYNIGFDKILANHSELSNATISSVIQDPNGFIWFGTDNGLYRLDGHNYKVFRSEPNKKGKLSNSFVDCLYIDSKGIFWVGTESGLYKFDYISENFTILNALTNDKENLNSKEILHLYEDKDGYLWIGTYKNGLFRFDVKNNTLQSFCHQDDNPGSLSNNAVNTILQDSKGLLWVGTDDGLNRLKPQEGLFTHYKEELDNPSSIQAKRITYLYEDNQKVLWIGTWGGGLHRYNPGTDTFSNYLIDENGPDGEKTGHNRISAIYEDQAGWLWVGTYPNGLCRFSTESKKFQFFRFDPYIPRSLNAEMITTLYEDNEGILWIGTYAGGLYTYDRKKDDFHYYFHHPLHKDSLSHNIVLSICEDTSEPGNIFWIGTYAGLNRFDSNTQTFTKFCNNPNIPNCIANNVIRYIYIDSLNNLWISTDSDLYKMDRNSTKCTQYLHIDLNSNSSISNGATPIVEDSNKNLWIGTKEGLNRFDRTTNTFSKWGNDPSIFETLNNSYILCIKEQQYEGNVILWIGTYTNGLFRLDYRNNLLKNYRTANSGLGNDTVRNIYEDTDNGHTILWLATDEGLNCFDLANGNWSRYTTEDGLPSGQLYGLFGDDTNNLWISSQNGLCRFNKKSRVITSIDEGYGVPIRNFNMDSYCQCQSGEIFFGGMNGFISFNPKNIQDNLHIPNVVITDFKILNPTARITEIPNQSIMETGEVHLSYKNSIFSIEFAVLDFTWPEKNRYKYKIEKKDKDWIETDARKNFVSYINLSPGKYIFRVIGSNNAGIWNMEGASLKITISPPFWQKLSFRILMGVGIILFLMGLYLLRTQRLRKELAEQQRVQHVLKQSHDIMEKARNLAEYRRAEIEKLISAISSILIAVDSKGEISQWNEPAEKCFHLQPSQTISQPFEEVLKHFITVDMIHMMLEKGLGPGNCYENFEIPVQLKDNGSKLLLGVINPIIDRDGNKLGFLLLAEDITHRKEEEMRRNLSQKLESLGKMIGNIAHEIKSPLQYIGNNSYFICDSFDDLVNFFNQLNHILNNADQSNLSSLKEKIKETFKENDIEYILEEVPRASDQIVKGVSRVSTIIQSMLEYTHPGRSIMEQANIHELLENTLVLIRSKKKELFDIETEFATTIPPILCYRGELLQVFMNLLINAADAIQESGKSGLIKINTSLKDNEVIVSITDNGCGIPEEVSDNIYNPFFTTKEVGKGTGQGLALVHNIITQRHKGSISFESKLGIGTTFYVHLPLPPEDE